MKYKEGIILFNRQNGDSVSLRPYILPVALIIITLIVGGGFVLRAVRNFHFRVLNEQSVQYAHSYADGITKTAQATAAIDELLEAKLLTAGRTIALYEEEVSGESLAALAASLELDEVYYFNAEGEILFSNHGRYIGWRPPIGHPVEDFMLSGDQIRVEEIRPDTESGNLFKYAYIRSGGGFFQIGISAQTVEGLLHAFRPVTILREIAEGSEHVDSISFVNNDFRIEESSDPALIGLELDSPDLRTGLAGSDAFSFVYALQDEPYYYVHAPVIVDGERVGGLLISRSLENTNRLVRQTTALGLAAFSIVGLALFYALYMTYRRKKELYQLSNLHSATGLPNRRSLHRRISRCSQPGSALFLIHIYRLDNLDHTYGHRFVEGFFQDLARHLQEAFSHQYEFVHYADNRLALFIEDALSRDTLEDLAQQFSNSVLDFFGQMGLLKQLGVGVAIVQVGENNHTPEELFADGAITLLNHSEDSPLPYTFFSQSMKERLQRENAISEELRTFLIGQRDQLLAVEFQPILDLATGEIAAFEALTRMRSPNLGQVSPLEFISIAEREQLIGELDLWVLKQGCLFLRRLEQSGFPQVSVAVNISGKELYNPAFPSRVGLVVQEHGINPARLVLEITESIMFESFAEISAAIRELKKHGVEIAIDDFGVGYSSFARLEELPVDEVKIDKSFIDCILTKDRDRLIIGELVAMCHKLGLRVVAEGVEEEEQRQYLREQGCDMMQGFLFSRSLPIDTAINKLKGVV